MKKIKTENQFIIISLIIIVLIGFLLIFFVSRSVRAAFINERESFLAQHIKEHAVKHLPPEVFNYPNLDESKKHLQMFYDELAINDIIRIKIYNYNKQIIFSDDEKAVGQIINDNPALDQALTGKIVDEYNDFDKDTDPNIVNAKNLTEMYMPLIYGDKQIGAVEIYYVMDSLNAIINKIQILILFLTVLAFLVLLFSLYWLYRRSSRQVEQAQAKEIKALEEVTKLKDDFVFIAAHELRAPATVIKGCIDMIVNGPKTKANIEKYLGQINATNNELINLINDLLEVARSDSGKLNIPITSQEVTATVKNAVEKFKPLTKEEGISLKYSPLKKMPKVMTNLEKVEEILNNLISNAIKYNKPKGKITISHELTNNTLITHVQDTGLGIKLEDQKHLFERFYRCSDSVCNAKGTGLGLFISKELVERMGGRIWFESNHGEGSTFSFELPLCFC